MLSISDKNSLETVVQKYVKILELNWVKYFCNININKLLQTQVLRVEQVDESCIGLTQENSIENSIQDCLPYILELHGPC